MISKSFVLNFGIVERPSSLVFGPFGVQNVSNLASKVFRRMFTTKMGRWDFGIIGSSVQGCDFVRPISFGALIFLFLFVTTCHRPPIRPRPFRTTVRSCNSEEPGTKRRPYFFYRFLPWWKDFEASCSLVYVYE